MPRVRATLWLPYRLKLQASTFPTGRRGLELEVGETDARNTAVSFMRDQPDTEDPADQSRLNDRHAEQLLNFTNRLLRCYRAITRDATITDLSLEQVGRFEFQIVSGGADGSVWEAELVFEFHPPTVPVQSPRKITKRVRELLAADREPDVADLFLLDAEQAIYEGRFREAVLFCWSTIDSTFNRKYDALIDERLANEWSASRDFFKSVDFGLKNKMSAALYLISERSLFRESDDLWQKLSTSYNKRNGIIHRGESADEADSRQALDIARRISDFMSAL